MNTTSADAITTIPAHFRTVRGSATPIVFDRDGQVFTNSEDVATYFGKQHAHVLRSIRDLISNEKSLASNFGFTSRTVASGNGASREVATCDMDRDGFTVLAMGFTGKRALGWKLAYIRAFNEMEKRLTQPGAQVLDPNQINSYEQEIRNLKVSVAFLERWVEALESKSLEDLIFSHSKKYAAMKHTRYGRKSRPEIYDAEERVRMALLAYPPKTRPEAQRKAEYIRSVPEMSHLMGEEVTALLSSMERIEWPAYLGGDI